MRSRDNSGAPSGPRVRRSHATGTRLVVLALAVMLAGCGDIDWNPFDDEPTETTKAEPAEEPAATVTTEEPAEPPSTVPVSGASLGGGEDPPPGVAGQLELYLGAEGDGCDVVEASPPYFSLAADLNEPSLDITIGVPYVLCIDGFEVGDPIQVEVTGPDGFRSLWELLLVDDLGQSPPFDLLAGGVDTPKQALTYYDSMKWTPEPGSQPGEYQIVATQGPITTSSGFVLYGATEETVTLLSDSVSSSAGGVLRFALAGFGPNASVPLYAYVENDGEGTRDFVAAIPAVKVDGNGEGYLDLTINPGDPPGYYCLVTATELANLPEEVELGFEYLADPCWVTTADFWVDP